MRKQGQTTHGHQFPACVGNLAPHRSSISSTSASISYSNPGLGLRPGRRARKRPIHPQVRRRGRARRSGSRYKVQYIEGALSRPEDAEVQFIVRVCYTVRRELRRREADDRLHQSYHPALDRQSTWPRSSPTTRTTAMCFEIAR